jgi:hypothetical protein
MLTFLFWNLKRDRRDVLANLARRHAVDVVMLTECEFQHGSALYELNQQSTDYFFVPTDCPKIQIYTRFSDEYLKPHVHGDDYTIRKLALPGRPEILLCVVHFPSKQHNRNVNSCDEIQHEGLSFC